MYLKTSADSDQHLTSVLAITDAVRFEFMSNAISPKPII